MRVQTTVGQKLPDDWEEKNDSFLKFGKEVIKKICTEAIGDREYHFEPSPERLDAQIRALAFNQDNLMKSICQQQQAFLDTNKSIIEALNQNKDVVEQLKKQLEELSLSINTSKERLPPKTVHKKVYLKPPGEDEEDYYDPNNILDYYEDLGEEYRASGFNFDRSSRLAHDPASGAAAALNYVVPPTLPPPGPPPAVNHFNYQYPPHGLVPTPPPAVPGRPAYYPPPGQGLPFNEGQQLPQFHFHVASAVGKPPPPPGLSTTLPQVVSGLPPPPSVTVPPPMPVPLPHGAVAPLTAHGHPWSKAVPHAFQIPLPPSTVMSVAASVPVITPVTASSSIPAVTSSPSQLRDLLQAPPANRTITFGLHAVTTTPAAVTTSPSIFAGLNKTPEISKERNRFDSENAASPDIDGHDLEREVMGDFKPLIPLPAEIVVETGEENEIVLFEDRAKLYRFIEQEWKERGIGVVKILHHEGSGRVRLLMRRDQVLKVCANHYITSNMEIHPLKNSDKAWTWVASDFADEELRPEHFCIRFKTPEIAAVFKTAFEKAINISREAEGRKVASPKVNATVTSTALSSPLASKPFGSKFLPKPGSWTCPTCYVSNQGDKLLCAACETKKPGSSAATSEVSSLTPAIVTSTVTSGFVGSTFPTATTSQMPGFGGKSLSTATTSVTTGFGGNSFSATSIATGFGGKTFPTTTTSGGFKFGFPMTSSNSMVSTTTTTTVNSAKNVFGGFTFTSNPVIQEAETPEVKDREILLVSTKAKNGPQVSKVSTPSPFSGFTFKSSPFTTVASTTQSSFVPPFSGLSSSPGLPLTTTISSATTTSANVTTTQSSSAASPFSAFPGLVFPPPMPFAATGSAKATTTSANVASTQSPSTTGPFSGFPGLSFPPPVPFTTTGSSAIATTANVATTQSSSMTGSFSGFSFKPPSIPVTVPSSQPINVPSTTSANISITDIQSSIKNISPAFVFSKDPESTSEVKSSASDSNLSGSVFTGPSSDASKTSGDFVFGAKPIAQPPTFTFGLSAISKSSETIGFKPTFSTATNAPAVFGGATQKTPENSTENSLNTSLFGNAEPKICSVLGGTAQKTDSKPDLASIFGGAQKTESAASTLNRPAASTESNQTKPVFDGLTEKSETKPLPDSFGTKKIEVSSSVPVVTTASQAVFNFGSSSEAKGDTGPVQFRFGSPQKYEFNFTGVRPRSPTKTPKSPATPSDAEEEEENESFDADNIYFQPVIPLPPKVDVKTGEEDERTLFCKRAKLFRFCSGEWKERGIGDFKILYDEVGKKVRLLMRRDQVLKVCLNHYLTKDITFEKRGDKTISWAATDFSENEPSPELFALRFKTSEFAEECLAAIESTLKSAENQSSNVDVSKAAASFSFKTDITPKTESLFTTGSLSSRFGTSSAPVFGTANESFSAAKPVSFSFKDKASSSTFFNIGSQGDSNVPDNQGLSSGTGSEENQIISAADDEIEVVYEATPSPEKIDLAKKYQLPPTFYLYESKPPCPGCIGCEDYVPPVKTVTQTSESENTNEAPTTTDDEKATGTPTTATTDDAVEQVSEGPFFNSSGGLSFADLAVKSDFKASPTSTQKKGFEGAGTPLFANLNNSAEGDEDAVAEGPDIHFEPVIPLPELIAVKTGEEDETPIFVNRAKLFRFDPLKKEWKERGVGDLKILKHNEKVRFRIILRREQVHKIACNHCIAENMELSPLATSATALCWNALDYSEGEPEACQFAVRFKNKELLEEFKQKFNECKEILKKAAPETSDGNLRKVFIEVFLTRNSDNINHTALK